MKKLFVLLSLMAAQALAGTGDIGSNAYGPRKESLVISFDPIEENETWKLGHNIMGEIFRVPVVGCDSLELNKPFLICKRGKTQITIGAVASEVSEAGGELGYPTATRKLTLTAELKYHFDHSKNPSVLVIE